jgi:hypothetical protein
MRLQVCSRVWRRTSSRHLRCTELEPFERGRTGRTERKPKSALAVTLNLAVYHAVLVHENEHKDLRPLAVPGDIDFDSVVGLVYSLVDVPKTTKVGISGAAETVVSHLRCVRKYVCLG